MFAAAARMLHTRRRRWLLTAIVAAAIALSLTPGQFNSLPRYEIGDYHVGNYRAPFALTVVDDQATAEARVQTGADVPPVYNHDPNAAQEAATRVADRFHDMNARCLAAAEDDKHRTAARRDRRADRQVNPPCTLDPDQRAAFADSLQVTLSDDQYAALAAAQFAPSLAGRLGGLFLSLYSHYVLADARDLQRRLAAAEPKQPPMLLTLQGAGRAQTVAVGSPDLVLDLVEAIAWLDERAPAAFADLPRALQAALLAIARAQVRPNLTLDAAATDAARLNVDLDQTGGRQNRLASLSRHAVLLFECSWLLRC
jgi:membrane-associated HD superfamily phosphohydrolase